MRFGFVTCVQLGLSCMEAIYASGEKLVLALTLEDNLAVRKSGRIYLDDFAARHDLPLVKIRHIDDAATVSAIRAHTVDWLFIIGWSQIAAPAVLQAPRKGVLGMHPTLLPTGRGRAAIPWAILKRLPETGVSLFQLAPGVDTGPIIAQRRIPLTSDTDATHLYAEVNAAHVSLIREVMPLLTADTLPGQPQDATKATVWPERRPEDGRIRMSGSVHEAECLIRAVTHPYPGAFVDSPAGRTVIWKARVVAQPQGKLCLHFHDGYLECLDYEPAPVTSSSRAGAPSG